MKTILVILLAVLSSNIFGQIKGQSRTGSLILVKPTKFKSPHIIIDNQLSREGKILTSDNSIQITGKVNDEYGIEEFTINGNKVELSNNNIFRFSPELYSGSNPINISALNSKGKLTEKRLIIDFLPKPQIVLNEPDISISKDLEHNNKSIIIRGHINNKNVLNSINLNDREILLDSDGNFQYELELNKGSNSVSITAEYNGNNEIEEKFTVNYVPIIETPILTLFEPQIPQNDTLLINKDKLQVKGNISAANSISSLKINEMQLLVSENGNFSHELLLKAGKNKVSITAMINSGEFIVKEFTVNAELKVTNPVISITNPLLAESLEFKHLESIITVRGKIYDVNDITGVFINNQIATLFGDKEFFSNIRLKQGINNIIVKATNIAGGSSQKIFKIITPVDLDGPEIVIYEPDIQRGLKIVRKTDVVDVKGKVIDKSGILELSINNRNVNLTPNNEFNTKMFLSLGENRIIVKAIDNLLNVTQDTFIVQRELEEIIKSGKYYALVIGINSYEGRYWRPLNNALNDAKGFSELISSDYKFDEIFTLFDKNATRRNIIQQFEWFTKNVKSNDNVLIFYAGHGQFKRELNKGYWVPVDARSNSIVDFVSNNEIKTLIAGIPSKHTLLISDACFAGDIFRGRNTEQVKFDPNNMSKYYREVYRKPSRMALTSGSLEQVSDAGKDNHSVFSYYLLKALKENKQKYLDVSQLFNEFKVAVVNNSYQTPQLQVIRDTNDEGGQFVFIKK